MEAYCNNCGRLIPAGTRFCSSCGKAVAISERLALPSETKRRWSLPIWKTLLILSLPVVLLFVWALASVIYHRATTPVAQLELEDAKEARDQARTESREKDAQEAERKQEEAARAPKLGTPIEVGDFTYTINDVKWKTILGEGELLQQRPDAAAFLVVDVTVRNIDEKPHFVENPQLVDSSGRKYTSTSNAFIGEGSELLLKELNPQVQSRGRIAFDVPYGSYSLRLGGGSDSLFHSSKTVPIVVYR